MEVGAAHRAQSRLLQQFKAGVCHKRIPQEQSEGEAGATYTEVEARTHDSIKCGGIDEIQIFDAGWVVLQVWLSRVSYVV